MIGCDIVKISRFDNKSPRLTNRILTQFEKEEFNNTTRKIEYLAGRWAAKEAIYKISGKFLELSILNNDQGAPYVKDHPEINVSISHETEYCIAVALMLK